MSKKYFGGKKLFRASRSVTRTSNSFFRRRVDAILFNLINRPWRTSL